MNNRIGVAMQKSYFPFLLPGIIIFLILIIFPFLANVGISFTRWAGVGTPEWIGFDNYTRVFNDSTFWASLLNNLRLIGAMTIIPTIIGLVLATVLYDVIAAKFGSRIASFFRSGFYLPQVIPVVAAGIAWRWIYQPEWGALNEFLRLVNASHLTQNWLGNPATAMSAIMAMMVWFQIGYPLVIFMAALQRIDPTMYETASIDGANWFQRLGYITVPSIYPEISVVALTTMIHALKVFGQVYIMTRGGPAGATIVASYFSYQNFFERANVGYGATISTILTVIAVLITVVFLKVQSSRQDNY